MRVGLLPTLQKRQPGSESWGLLKLQELQSKSALELGPSLGASPAHQMGSGFSESLGLGAPSPRIQESRPGFASGPAERVFPPPGWGSCWTGLAVESALVPHCSSSGPRTRCQESWDHPTKVSRPYWTPTGNTPWGKGTLPVSQRVGCYLVS